MGPLDTVGPISPEIADRFGLKQDVVVAPGSGDNMMAALGAGAVVAGDLVVSLGTSGTVFGTADLPVLDPGGTIAPFCDATGARALPRLRCFASITGARTFPRCHAQFCLRLLPPCVTPSNQ